MAFWQPDLGQRCKYKWQGN